jgi:hypothetical protein
VEKDSWRGELVVNIFVRVVLFAGGLFVDFYAHVLLPLHPDIAAAERLPITGVGRLIGVLRDTPRWTAQLARGAPRWLWEDAWWRWRLHRRPIVERKLIRKMPSFNYGATEGIRARVAAERREWLFAYEDEDMFVQALRGLVLSNVIQYVHDHGIDTSDLEKQQTRIFSKTYKIGDIKGKNVMIGDHNSLKDLASGWANGKDDGGPQQSQDDDDDDNKGTT